MNYLVIYALRHLLKIDAYRRHNERVRKLIAPNLTQIEGLVKT